MKNIVTIGGGTGSFTLLSGLKKYPINISAIVSMVDDGGSTGRLRDELGVLPPGDVRQCLVALSNSPKNLRELMNYRFESGDLKGHNFGNLFLSALEKTSGSFLKGIAAASEILKVNGEIIPVSEGDMRLLIRLRNGKILKGEKELDSNKEIRRIGIKSISLKSKVKPNLQALSAIKQADVIIIGPGDFFGSVLPNLLIGEISKAVNQAKAPVIFVCNLTNKKGQTEGFYLDKYVAELNKFIGKGRINFVLFNNKKPAENLIRKYEEKEGKNSMVLLGKRKKEFKIISADLLSRKIVKIKGNVLDMIARHRSFIRHDSEKLAKIIIKILTE
jgi:uncharacterized cofD-like protein